MAEMQPPSQPAAPMQPHRGVMVLVFGLVSLIPCCLPVVLGVLAIVFGSQDLKAMEQGRMDPSGKGMTQAGLIIGIVSIVEQILVLVYVIFVGVLARHMMQHGQFPPMPR